MFYHFTQLYHMKKPVGIKLRNIAGVFVFFKTYPSAIFKITYFKEHFINNLIYNYLTIKIRHGLR